MTNTSFGRLASMSGRGTLDIMSRSLGCGSSARCRNAGVDIGPGRLMGYAFGWDNTFALPLVLGKGLIGIANVLPSFFGSEAVLALAINAGRVVGIVKDLVGSIEHLTPEHISGAADALDSGFDILSDIRHDG